MTQPPQDRPDYPWGPSDADRGERAPSPSPRDPGQGPEQQGPERQGPERQGPPPGSGGSTRAGDLPPRPSGPQGSAPDAPHTGTPYTGTPHRGSPPAGAGSTPYTGTRVDELPPIGPPSDGDHPGYPPDRRDGPEAGTTPVSTIVLLVLSGLVLLVTLASFVGIVFAAPVVLAIVALTRQASDPASARRLTRIGWWIFAGLLVLGAVLITVLIALAVSLGGFASTVGPGANDPFGATSTPLAALLGVAG